MKQTRRFHDFIHELSRFLFMNLTGFLCDLEAYLLHIGLLGTTARNYVDNYYSRPGVTRIWLCYRTNRIVYTCTKTNDLDNIVVCFLTCCFFSLQKSLVPLSISSFSECSLLSICQVLRR